jgi:hypothetical protein
VETLVTPRLFSLRDANALVPTLRETFTKARVLRERLGKLQKDLSEEGHPHSGGKIEVDPRARPEVQGLQRRAALLLGELLELLKGVTELGIEVKQADGLCDLRTRFEGRIVYLCWKFGEERITHFHELDAGFAGRKPLPVEGEFGGDLLH